MLKKIAFTLLAMFLAYNSYKFVNFFFVLKPEQISLPGAIASAATLNLLITGIFAFLGFVYPTHQLLPANYYRIKNTHRLNTVYKWLGVTYFKYFLLLTFYRKNDNKQYFNGTKSGIQQFDYNIRQSEFGHLMAFICILLLSLVLLTEGHQLIAVWIQPINIVFNFYPIILQRKHRIAIKRVVDRV